MQRGSILGAMTGSRFVGITPWPGGEWEKACIHCFVGSELSFLKLVSVLVGLSGGVSNFSSKPAQPKLLLLGSIVCFGL